MYERDATETSKGTLVELCRALRQYKSEIVLAGGWAPYFLVQGHFDHCGSVDIDLVLRSKVVERYERIKQIIERLGYKPTGSVFRFERSVASPATGVLHRVEVDFLTDTEGAKKLPEEWLASVQSDLKACIVEGSSIVFKYNREVKFRAIMPRNGEALATINCADIVGALTMKGLALYRMKDKDSYDVYAVAGFYDGGPKQASRAFMGEIERKKGPEEVTLRSLNEIREAFASPTAQGPSAAVRFTASEDVRIDSHQRIKAFLENLAF